MKWGKGGDCVFRIVPSFAKMYIKLSINNSSTFCVKENNMMNTQILS